MRTHRDSTADRLPPGMHILRLPLRELLEQLLVSLVAIRRLHWRLVPTQLRHLPQTPVSLVVVRLITVLCKSIF